MTISIKPTASGSTIEQDGSTILTVDGSGNITPSNQLYPKVPAFSATKDGSTVQSIGNSVWTKITYDTEEFDTNSHYDASTSIFTPTVAGYYQINASVYFVSTENITHIGIYKNGSFFKRGVRDFADNDGLGQSQQAVISVLIYMNGSTDYLEVYGLHSSGLSRDVSGSEEANYFQAYLVSV